MAPQTVQTATVHVASVTSNGSRSRSTIAVLKTKGETRRAGTAGGGPGSGSARQSSGNPARAGGVVGRWVKRLTALQEKERTIPSPFTIPEPVVSGCVQAEFSRLQSVIDGLQKRSGQPVQATSVDDDDMMESRHKRSKMAPKTPLAITGVPGTPPIFNGTEGPSPLKSLVSGNPSA